MRALASYRQVWVRVVTITLKIRAFPADFSLDRPTYVPCVLAIAMKRAQAAAPKQTDLVRQRALVRFLIEQNGWSSSGSPVSVNSPRPLNSLASNIIQFPGMEKRSRIS